MKPLHPILQRAFALAKVEPSPAPPDLEERVLAAWKGVRPTVPVKGDGLRELRVALVGALTLLLVTCAVSMSILNHTSDDSSIVLANSALQVGLTHDDL